MSASTARGGAKYTRALTPELLAELPVAERVQLLQALGVELGHRPGGLVPRGDATDLLLKYESFGQPRVLLLRLLDREAAPDDVDLAQADAERQACHDFLLVYTAPSAGPQTQDGGRRVLAVDQLIRLIEASALLTWTDGLPGPDLEAYQLWRIQRTELQEFDPVGVPWLAALGRNKLPRELRDSTTPAETWFERIVFRVALRVFRLDGRLYGSATAGKRLPDAILVDPPTGGLAIIDTKAARDGWTMTAAEERKLVEYAQHNWTWLGAEKKGSCVIVVSSSFGTPASARRAKFLAVGSDLIYIETASLARAASRLMTHPEGHRAAQMIRWSRVLRMGDKTGDALVREVDTALARAVDERSRDEAK